MTAHEQTPEQIERDISVTRAEIGNTLDALQSKLSPGELLDHALGYLKGGTADFASSLGRSARNNPIPLTLLGVSLAWLMLMPRSAGSEREQWPNETYRRPRNGDGEDTLKPRGIADSAGETLGKAREFGAEAKEQITAAGAQAQEYAQHAWDEGKHLSRRVGDYGTQAWEQGRQATRSVGRFVEEYPLAVAALGLAVGAAAAACLPRLQREDAIMGEASDRVKEAVQDTVREEANRVKEAASTAMQEATATAEDRTHGGHSPSDAASGWRASSTGTAGSGSP